MEEVDRGNRGGRRGRGKTVKGDRERKGEGGRGRKMNRGKRVGNQLRVY